MKVMSTYGSLTAYPDQKLSKRFFKNDQGEWVTLTFQYTKPFANHFNYRHAVDDNNNLRHAIPSLEMIWTTHHWPRRVFRFLLAITEINICLAKKYFNWSKKE
eukprot:1826882-Ditylum_brightwellii.AAC.1